MVPPELGSAGGAAVGGGGGAGGGVVAVGAVSVVVGAVSVSVVTVGVVSAGFSSSPPHAPAPPASSTPQAKAIVKRLMPGFASGARQPSTAGSRRSQCGQSFRSLGASCSSEQPHRRRFSTAHGRLLGDGASGIVLPTISNCSPDSWST